MDKIMRLVIFIFFAALFQSCHATRDSLPWRVKEFQSNKLYFTKEDGDLISSLENYLGTGKKVVWNFFETEFKHPFRISIFPSRAALDSQWTADWNLPGFKSECWMIASGVAKRLDILSPRVWDKQACDHNGNDVVEVQQVITHEMVHVFHAQVNPSNDFEGMDDLSWLIEGLATFVSGQLTEEKIKSVKEQINSGNIPSFLADFWKGKTRYQQAGSLIKYINDNYGRVKLIALLTLTNLSAILESLGVSENQLIEGWVKYYN